MRSLVRLLPIALIPYLSSCSGSEDESSGERESGTGGDDSATGAAAGTGAAGGAGSGGQPMGMGGEPPGGSGGAEQTTPCSLISVKHHPLVRSGDVWRWHTGTDYGDAWWATDFDDSGWYQGPSQLGFGDADEATILRKSVAGEPSYLFRRRVLLDGNASAGALNAVFDDGIAVWINGAPVLSENVEDGLEYSAFASGTSDDNAAVSVSLPDGLLTAGWNTIAAIVKNSDASSSDISFDLTLTADVEMCSTQALTGPFAPIPCDDKPALKLTSSGLPLLESNPGAPVALFLDFDGGNYNDVADYGGYDTDGDPSTFSETEQADIARSVRHVSEYFAMFDVNVTTDDAARAASNGWGWIIVTEDEGGGKGVFSNSAIGTPDVAQSYVGAECVRSSDRSRRLAHELGHNFMLDHNGVWEESIFYKWEDWGGWDSVYGTVMGGGGSAEINGWGFAHVESEEGVVQDSMAVIVERVKAAGGGQSGFRVDDFSDSEPSALCDGTHLLRRTGVLGHPQDEDLFAFPSRGGGALVEVRALGVSSADPVVELQDESGTVLGTAGYFDDLPEGVYHIRVRTRSGLENGYDRESIVAFDDVGRSELGMYEVTVDSTP